MFLLKSSKKLDRRKEKIHAEALILVVFRFSGVVFASILTCNKIQSLRGIYIAHSVKALDHIYFFL
jgi:hypothetical protein